MSTATRMVALVQGASRGIGLAFVTALSERKDLGTVFATCRRPQEAQELCALAARNDKIRVVTLDVTDESSIAAAAGQVAAKTAHLDMLINSAGLLHQPGQMPERRLRDLDAAHLLASFQVNAVGPILMARYFEALLAKSPQAVFASLSARVGSITDNRLGGWYSYRASKAAQNMLTRTLTVEWSRLPRPIICLALHPGTVNTDLSRPFQKRVPPDKLFSTERAAAQLLEIISRAGPEDSGRFIAWDGQDIPW